MLLPPSFFVTFVNFVVEWADVSTFPITLNRRGYVFLTGHPHTRIEDPTRPLIGPTTIEGAYVLGALSGFGNMASQAAAEVLAAHVLDRPLPDYAAAFHPARFRDPAYQRVLAALSSTSGQL